MPPPIDPRLMRRVHAVRRWIGWCAGLQVASAVLLIGQAIGLATLVAAVAADSDCVDFGLFTLGRLSALLLLVGAFVARAAVAWWGQRLGFQASTSVIASLRGMLLRHAEIQPHLPHLTQLTSLATSGLAGLEGYLTRFLPQVISCTVVLPVLLVVVAVLDPLSALLMVLTVPLIPLFLVLVGWMSHALSQQRVEQMGQLGQQLLDLIAGLPTLRAHGRALAQAGVVREVGQRYARRTLAVLRVAFLSSLVLELLASLSVALVAVGIGMRLVYGHVDLATGLTVLILAPEVYLPLRMVGLHFHASTDGLAAADAAFASMDAGGEPSAQFRGQKLCQRFPTNNAPEQLGPVQAIEWQQVSVSHPGREGASPWKFSGCAGAGQLSVVAGPNGSGKSSLFAALLGVGSPSTGRVALHTATGTIDVEQVLADPALRELWWQQVVWLPQHPVVVAASVADNLSLLTGPVTVAMRQRAAQRTGLDAIVEGLPHGWETVIGEQGVGLSAGQRQRLALTRALIRLDPEHGAPPVHVVICDEPGAHLDPATEALLPGLLREMAAAGALVLVAAHRPAWLEQADQVLPMQAQPTGSPPVEAAQ